MDEIDQLLDEILVDAYGDSEQLSSFEIAFEESARFPFPARVVGAPVDVVKVEYEGDERRGLTAVCRRDGELHRVSLTDLIPGPVTLETSDLLNAYRRWSGLPPLKQERTSSPGPPNRPWVYHPIASRTIQLAKPLALTAQGDWDPVDQYWGEDDTDLDPLIEQVIAAGPRLAFEMEQVIPGIEADDWDLDPVADAAQWHRVGNNREATRILKGLISQDERCVDAWVHLGNIALDANRPKAALDLYDTAVAIAEQSLPPGFNGVLPRGLVDNRPFLRALHGLGLCAWRQRRWEDAEAIFTNLVWIDGGDTWTSISCLQAARSRQRWSRG
jgi:tetratricopeptide (TPR) repeat protein